LTLATQRHFGVQGTWGGVPEHLIY
jgi:hypothetical protein